MATANQAETATQRRRADSGIGSLSAEPAPVSASSPTTRECQEKPNLSVCPPVRLGADDQPLGRDADLTAIDAATPSSRSPQYRRFVIRLGSAIVLVLLLLDLSVNLSLSSKPVIEISPVRTATRFVDFTRSSGDSFQPRLDGPVLAPGFR